MSLTRTIFAWGPLWFGVGFIAPLVAQSMTAANLSAPLGMTETAFGLAVGVTLGTIAKLRGSWI